MKISNGYTHKFNLAPRLSAGQVAEYLKASASDRHRIITEAKYPPTFLVVHYDEAREALVKHLSRKQMSGGTLREAVEALTRKAVAANSTDWTKKQSKLSREAIETFQAQEEHFGLGQIRFRRPNIGHSKIAINGVAVSVSLDLMAEISNDDGTSSVGGTILCLWKTRKSDIPNRCEAMAMLACEVVRRSLKSGQTCSPRLCMAVDIFGGKVYRAKEHQKMLFKTVELSCREVATMWPSVEPPANYNGPPVSKAS